MQKEFLNTVEAASLLGLSPFTLRNFRARREGPAFFKLGGKSVRYKRADLLAWARVGRVEKFPRSRINAHGESGQHFLKAFGPAGGVYFAQGLRFEKAKALHRKAKQKQG